MPEVVRRFKSAASARHMASHTVSASVLISAAAQQVRTRHGEVLNQLPRRVDRSLNANSMN